MGVKLYRAMGLSSSLDRAAHAVLRTFAIPDDLNEAEKRASVEMAYAVAAAVIKALIEALDDDKITDAQIEQGSP